MHRSVIAALIASGCALNGDRTLTWDLERLPPLAEGSAYELWLETQTGSTISLGQLGDRTEVTISGPLSERAERFLVTIEDAELEPADEGFFDLEGTAAEPSDTVVLAGSLLLPQEEAGQLFRRAELTMAQALGVDPARADGGYTLMTPTTETEDDFDQGIWYMIPGDGASLDLPDLPAGWLYEGWVLAGGLAPELRSTGLIYDPSSSDSDGAGPDAGDLRAPAFPGQDFIDPPLMVPGSTVLISLEPDPDDNPDAPWLVSVLHDVVEDVGPGALQYMDNVAGQAMPFGEVRISR